MITVIKVLVEIIKILIVFEKSTNGPLSQLIEKLEERINSETKG